MRSSGLKCNVLELLEDKSANGLRHRKLQTYYGGDSPKLGNELGKSTTGKEPRAVGERLNRWTCWGTSENDRRYTERLETHIRQG